MSTPSKIAGVGASLARFALNKPVTIGMLFLSMLLFGIVSGRLLPLGKYFPLTSCLPQIDDRF